MKSIHLYDQSCDRTFFFFIKSSEDFNLKLFN